MAKIPASTKGVPTPAEQAAKKASTVVAKIPEDKEEKATAAKEEKAPKEPGKIAQILDLFRAGKTNKEIAEAGFHPTTIAIQVSKYKKAHPDLYPVVAKVKKEKPAKAAKAEAVEATA